MFTMIQSQMKKSNWSTCVTDYTFLKTAVVKRSKWVLLIEIKGHNFTRQFGVKLNKGNYCDDLKSIKGGNWYISQRAYAQSFIRLYEGNLLLSVL